MDAFFDILEKEENANVIRIKLNLKEFEKLKDKEELYMFKIINKTGVRVVDIASWLSNLN